jgi:spore coat protein U-like protein
MNKAIRLIAAGALLAAGVPLSAMAQTATITINATVANQCNIQNASVDLGTLDLSVVTNGPASNMVLTCNRNAAPTIALNNGATNPAGPKQLGLGAFRINYNIRLPTISGETTSCPTLPGTEWNASNTLAASTLFTASGGPRNVALCVSVPAGQYNVGAGSYTDTVTATVSF